MKYILIVLLATMAMPTFSQEKDKEVMIKKIFRTLQQKDESGFIKLFPDAAIMKEFVLKEIGEDTLNEEYKTMLADITNSSLQKEFGEMFKEIIEKGEGKGVEWAKTNFVSFTADTSVEEESEMARLEGKIYFNVGKLEYFLNYDEIIWFENYGWYGVSIDRIDEKSKENDPEEMEVQVADSTMMMMDSVAAVMDTVKVIPEKSPVIKPSKNEKTPVKNNTVKPKNQMEAKKPE